MAAKLPSIPVIDSTIAPEIKSILSPIKQILDSALAAGRSGSPGPFGGITEGQILDALPEALTDSTIPHAPTHVEVVGGFAIINLQWDKPAYRNHGYAEIWRNEADNLGSAVLIGQSPGVMFSDAIGNSMSAFYWVRFVSTSGVTGPYQATSGIHGETALDPEYTLSVLSGAITGSQLHQSLGSRIDLIDAPTTGLVTMQAQTLAALDSLHAAVSDMSGTQVYSDTETYSLDDLVTYGGALYRALGPTTGNLPTNATYWDKVGNFSSLVGAVAGNSEVIEDHSARIATAEGNIIAESNARILLASTVADNQAALIQNYSTKADTNSAIASSVAALNTKIDSNQAAITSESTTRASVDSALSSSISTVQTTVNGHTTSIQTLSATADGLSGQYTVKIDANGYVAGFGLASTPVNGTPVSEFLVRADRFAIAAPEIPGGTHFVPFVVQTTAQTIDGVDIPAGVYMDAAFIRNGVIKTAQIGLAAIDNARIANAAITEAKIDDLAVTSAKIQDAAITSAKIGTAAIGTAHIADATITNAKIGLLAVKTANIDDLAVTSAKIVSLEANKISATSLSSITANLGTITAGRAQNASNTNYVDFNATGTANFLQVGSKARIRADGYAEFTDLKAIGSIYTGSAWRDSASDQVILSSASSHWWQSSLQIGSRPAVMTASSMRFYGPNYHSVVSPSQRVRGSSAGGVVTFFVTASATVDHYFSIWYRVNGVSVWVPGYYTQEDHGWYNDGTWQPNIVDVWHEGYWESSSSWSCLAYTVEPQKDYGSAAVSGSVTLYVEPDWYVDFGVAPANASMSVLNMGKSEIRNLSVYVSAVNV